jgi:multicomponent Na+:H+ antiporter subunit G
MSIALDVATVALLALAAFATLTGALGLLRLPDFFSRTHAVGVLDTAAAGLALLGFALQSGLSLTTFKLALVLVFLLITGPTATHALARAARHAGVDPHNRGGRDEQSPR